MTRRLGLLLVCCVLLAACSAGSAASSSPSSRVTLTGTFADDSFRASDYYGNACASFESGTWQVQVKAAGSTTVAVVVFTNTTVADAPGSGPGETGYGLCAGSWSVTVPKSADYVLTVASAGDDGNSQLPGSLVVPGSYVGFDIQLGDHYGEDLTD
jgi:type 1 fimbria pilin